MPFIGFLARRIGVRPSIFIGTVIYRCLEFEFDWSVISGQWLVVSGQLSVISG